MKRDQITKKSVYNINNSETQFPIAALIYMRGGETYAGIIIGWIYFSLLYIHFDHSYTYLYQFSGIDDVPAIIAGNGLT